MEKIDVLVLGSGIAAISAADAARKENPELHVLVCTREKAHPYYRLRVQERLIEAQKNLELHEDEWYDLREINVRYGMEAVGLNTDAKSVSFLNGSVLYYEKLIIATGSRSFVPPIEGADGREVYTLWTIEDADEIKAHMRAGSKTIVIGGGLLGLETAHKLYEAGEDVMILEAMDRLLARQTDPESSALFQRKLESMGIKVKLNVSTKSIEDSPAGKLVTLSDNTLIPCHLIIISTGVRANVEWLTDSGLDIHKRIIVNGRMETSLPDIYAAGDVATQDGLWFGLWSVSMKQGRVAGINAAGGDENLNLEIPPYVLNTMGTTLASAGEFTQDEYPYEEIEMDEEAYTYRRVIYQTEAKDGPILGYILLGPTAAKENAQLYKRLVNN